MPHQLVVTDVNIIGSWFSVWGDVCLSPERNAQANESSPAKEISTCFGAVVVAQMKPHGQEVCGHPVWNRSTTIHVLGKQRLDFSSSLSDRPRQLFKIKFKT